MVGVIEFLESGILVIIGVLGILILIIIGLTIVQKKVKKKLQSHEAQIKKFQDFQTELQKLQNSKESPEKVLINFDKYVKNSLRERFQLSDKIDYSTLSDIFERLNKPNLVKFTDDMLITIYSGESITKEKINQLVSQYAEIVKQERITPVFREHPEKEATGDLIKAPKLPPQKTQIKVLKTKNPMQVPIIKSAVFKTVSPSRIISQRKLTALDKKIQPVQKEKRGFFAWLFGSKSKTQQTPIQPQLGNKITIQRAPKQPIKLTQTPKAQIPAIETKRYFKDDQKTPPHLQKEKKGFFAWLFGSKPKKTIQPISKDSARSQQSQIQKPTQQVPVQQPQEEYGLGTYQSKDFKESSVKTQIPQTKIQIPKTKIRQIENPNLESIDDMDRIRKRIELIKKLRKEAKLTD